MPGCMSQTGTWKCGRWWSGRSSVGAETVAIKTSPLLPVGPPKPSIQQDAANIHQPLRLPHLSPVSPVQSSPAKSSAAGSALPLAADLATVHTQPPLSSSSLLSPLQLTHCHIPDHRTSPLRCEHGSRLSMIPPASLRISSTCSVANCRHAPCWPLSQAPRLTTTPTTRYNTRRTD